MALDPRIGTDLAGYRIIEAIGRGGMGVVYLAEHHGLRRRAALKILAPELAADHVFRERFAVESRLAASIDHPNIVPIYEAGEVDGTLFIAMRYVEGDDLRTVLAREERLTPERTVALLAPIADALDAAHAVGLVHRDVKTANILLDRRDDHPYLTDFGLTKEAGTSSGLTRTGQFLGTPDYIAPEQIDSGTVDGRADQYALACVAFEMLTGVLPHHRDTDLATLVAHLNEPPPDIRGRRPDLPRGLTAVFTRGLARSPDDRFIDCRALIAAVAETIGASPSTGPTTSGRVRPERKVARSVRRGGAVVLVAAIVTAIATSIAVGGSFVGGPRLVIAYADEQRVEGLEDPVVCADPWSGWYEQYSRLRTVDPRGGPSTRLARAPTDVSERFPSPYADGSAVAFTGEVTNSNSVAFRLGMTDSSLVRVAPAVDVLTGPAFYLLHPTPSPDGRLIAYALETRDSISGIFVAEPQDADPTLIREGAGLSVSWLGDGRLITSASSHSELHEPQPAMLHEIGGAAPPTIVPVPAGSVDVTFSPDGRLIALINDGTLHTSRPDGSELRALTSGIAATEPSWSPDSKQIAFAAATPEGGSSIRTIGSDGSQATTVVESGTGHAVCSPVWMDSAHVAGKDPARTADPDASPQFERGPLEPGRYRSEVFKPAVTLAVGQGLVGIRQFPDVVELARLGGPVESYISIVRVRSVADPCISAATILEDSPEALVDWLRRLTFLDTKVGPVTAAGHSGLEAFVTVRSVPTEATCPEDGGGTRWDAFHTDDGAYHLEAGDHLRVIALDVAGATITVIIWSNAVEGLADVDNELIVESLAFDP